MSYEAKLKSMGYELQVIDLNMGKIMGAVRTGNLVYTSGQTSKFGDKQIIGKVGADLTVDPCGAVRLDDLLNRRGVGPDRGVQPVLHVEDTRIPESHRFRP